MELAPLATLLIAFILIENDSSGQCQPSQVENASSKQNFPSFRASQLAKKTTKTSFQTRTTTRATFKPLTTKKTLSQTTKRPMNQPLKQRTTVRTSTLRTTKSITHQTLKKTTSKDQLLKKTTTMKKFATVSMENKISWTEKFGDVVLEASLDSILNQPSYDDNETITTDFLELAKPPEKNQQTLNGTDATTEVYEEFEPTAPMDLDLSSTIEANFTLTTRKKLKRRKTATPVMTTRKKLKRRRTTTKNANREIMEV